MGNVVAFPGVTLTTRETRSDDPPRPPATPKPCPVCAYPISADEYEVWYCDGCKALLHGPCYWGRVAPLQEWLDYLKWVESLDFDKDPGPHFPVVCSACRQLEGLAK